MTWTRGHPAYLGTQEDALRHGLPRSGLLFVALLFNAAAVVGGLLSSLRSAPAGLGPAPIAHPNLPAHRATWVPAAHQCGP